MAVYKVASDDVLTGKLGGQQQIAIPSAPAGSAETQIVIFLHQSNEAGGQTTATGASLVSPADDAQAGLTQWSPNGGGPYTGVGVESFPANARTLLPASGGGMLNPQTIDVNRVGRQYSFMKAAQAAVPGPHSGIPMGVGGTSTVEYTIASGVPSNWPGNRYSVLQTAYNTFKAAVPNSRIYAFVASILENEIQNVDSIVTLPGIIDQWIADLRALGGAGASTAPFILSSPLIEWLTYAPSRLAYLLEGAKAAVRNSNVGFIRPQRGFSVPADVIHMTNVGNRIHGPEMHAHRAVAIAQTTTPSSPPSVSMTGERLSLVSTGNPYYEVWYRAPAGSGAYTKTDFVPLENSGVGQTINCVAPGQGGRDLIVIGKAKAGDSMLTSPTSGTAPMITYAVPAVTPPTPVVSLDIDNASLDGSLNIISIPSNGSDTTAWTPTSAAGQGATAALKRVLVGSKYGLVLDSTSKCVWRGSAYVFPSGDISVVMPMLFATSGITGTFVGCGQSGTTMDIFFTMANASLNVRGGFTSSSVQVISVSNFLNFQNTTAFYRFFAWTYRRTGNVLTVYMDDDIVLSGTPTQRAASPANSGGTRFYNSGLDTATVGWGGSTVALPPKAYNAELSFNELMKIKNDYRVDHGVNFGYAPS